MRGKWLPVMIVAFFVGSACLCAAEEEKTIPVCGAETTDGTAMTWGSGLVEKRLELNKDKRFVSQGEASLHLYGRTAPGKGKYLGVKIPIPETDMVERKIFFDAWTTHPSTTEAVYLRLYRADGKMVGSWSNWGSPFEISSHRTFELHRCFTASGFHFEQKWVEDRQPSKVTTIEIVIGSRPTGNPFDIYLDNFRISEKRYRPIAELSAAKKLFLKTSIVSAGKAQCMVVVPRGKGYQASARQLCDKIEELTGARVPITTEDACKLEELRASTTIMMGSINTNRHMVPLYGLGYVLVDDCFPGGDGFVIRTVHDPWGTGKNVVILGSAAEAGVEKAVNEFLGMLKPGRDIVLDRLTVVKPGSEYFIKTLGKMKPLDKAAIDAQVERGRSRLLRGGHRGITPYLIRAGESYRLTGDDGWGEVFKREAYIMYESYLSKPDTYGGPWGMDADFSLYRLIPAWDVVEESAAFTDQDRLKITKILAEFTDYCSRKARSVIGRETVRHNHQTFPSLGLFYAGTYYHKYYGSVEAEYWLDTADWAFRVQSRSWKAYEDCNGYQWLTLYHTMKYALAKPYHEFFLNGNARRAADYAIICMDNIGYQVPYGDTGSFRCWTSEVPYLKGAAWFYKDGRYQWAVDKKAALRPDNTPGFYVRNIPPMEPTDLLGLQTPRPDRMFYDKFAAEGDVPYEKTVDKVVMRASFDPDKQYLLLDGINTGGHKHYDGNSISRITDRERIWLADNDYLRANAKYHNGVLIFKNGQSAPIPKFCELELAVDLADVAFSRTCLRDYAGVDWHRTICWLKEEAFLVVDDMIAREEADYAFRCKWHLVGDVKLHPDWLEVEQKGKFFHVKNTAGPRLKLYDDRVLGLNWAGYEFADPVVRVLEQNASAHLAAGRRYTFFNLLYGSDEDRPQDFDIRSVGESVVAVHGRDGTQYVGMGRPGEVTRVGPVEVAASAFCISADGYRLADGDHLVFGKALFESERPVSVAARRGKVVLIASEPTKATITNAEGKQVTIDVARGRREMDFDPLLPAGIDDAVSASVAAPAPSRKGPADIFTSAPELKQRWSYVEPIGEIPVSGNAGARCSAEAPSITCKPAPLPRNVFNAECENKIENALDGGVKGTENCVMWDTDQPVEIALDLKQKCDISRVVVHAWWADSSSKRKTYQLARIVLRASDDGFNQDTREVASLTDDKAHENWGGKKHLPEKYELKGRPFTARWLRFEMTPRKGSGIYVAEIEVLGKPAGREITPALLAKMGYERPKFTCLAAADLDGSGRQCVIAGSENAEVYCLGPDGRIKWRFKTGGPVRAVSPVDFSGDGKPFVAAGSDDAVLYVIQPDGKLKWKTAIPYYKRKPIVRTLFGADLDGTGRQKLIAGADSWRYYAFDADGKELWHYESVRASSKGTAADIDGDGRDEVLAGTVYYWWHCINPDGTKKWGYSSGTGPIVNAVAAGDLDGDGKKEAVFGGADGNLHVVDDSGKRMWLFSTGDEITGVAVTDINGDGKAEVLAASMNFNVYAIDGAGKCLWRRELPDTPRGLVLADLDGDGRQEVCTGCEDGGVYVFDLSGKPFARARAGAPVLDAAPATFGGKKSALIVVCSDGSLRALSM